MDVKVDVASAGDMEFSESEDERGRIAARKPKSP
jgi:hypothetical protein